MRVLSIFLSLAVSLSLSAQGLPPYYDSYIEGKKAELSAVRADEADGFFFWTDTHCKPGSGIVNRTPQIINAVTDDAGGKVIWGGDAVTAYTDEVEKCWQMQMSLFGQIKPSVSIYPARGNHDLTARISKEVKEGYGLSPKATFKCFSKATTGQVVRNTADKNALYYYFDVPQAKIRYIVADVFDRFDGTDVYWGVKPGVSDIQLGWIRDEALLKAPRDYALFFVMHSCIMLDKDKCYEPLRNLLSALAAHTGVFENRKDLRLLMVLCGHRHHDMQTSRGGYWNVQTECDALYKDNEISPFSDKSGKRKKESVTEQAFDYVSISKDFSKVSMIRLGADHNRTFNINSIVLNQGDRLQLQSEGTVRWTSYDCAVRYVRPKGKAGRWNLVSTVAGVTPKGEVFALEKGEGVVVGLDSDGNQEFFHIIVK